MKSKFNGILGGYQYSLEGIDKWNRDDYFNGVTTSDVNGYVFEDLQPMSRYVLKLFVMNRRGQINETLPLLIYASTRKSNRVENPPRNVKVSLSNESLLISWEPPYPPTSSVTKYIAQWQFADRTNKLNKWIGLFEVAPEIRSCQKLNVQVVNPDTMCHKILNFRNVLDQKHFQLPKNVVLRIGARSHNQRSMDIIWSKKVMVHTGIQKLHSEENTGLTAIAVTVNLVVIFMLILAVICHRCKSDKVTSRNGKRI